MRTVTSQHRYEGLSLTLETHAWLAGERFTDDGPQFNIMQACTRRPVPVRLYRPVGSEQRLGRLVLTPANFNMPVEAISDETSFPVRRFELDPRWFNRLVSSVVDFDFTQADAQPVFDDPLITGSLDRIHAEMTAPRGGSEGLLDCLLRILAIDMARLLAARSKTEVKAEKVLTPEQLAQIQRTIETTEFRHLTPSAIAAGCDMSLPRLRDAFRRTTGRMLREQIEDARMSAACRMLAESVSPLKVIAHQLGFGHASAFCYSFKTTFGLTPTEYRLQNAAMCPGSC